MLLTMLERYRQERYPFKVRQAAAYGAVGFNRERWVELGELGVVASLFSAASGGSGGDGFDIMVLFEWLGRALAVEPFLASLMVVVAHAEAADSFLVSARSPAGLTLFLVPADVPGLQVHGHLNIEGGRSGDVHLNRVRLDDAAMVGGEGSAAPLVDSAIEGGLLALSAEAVGAMDAMKEATLEHLRTRVQFGQPIGRFQALQHRMASMLLEIEQARSSVINAAAAFNREENAERSLALSAPKSWPQPVAQRCH